MLPVKRVWMAGTFLWDSYDFGIRVVTVKQPWLGGTCAYCLGMAIVLVS